MGDIVIITMQHKGGWWHGMNCCSSIGRNAEDDFGIFPGNHVELLDDSDSEELGAGSDEEQSVHGDSFFESAEAEESSSESGEVQQAVWATTRPRRHTQHEVLGTKRLSAALPEATSHSELSLPPKKAPPSRAPPKRAEVVKGNDDGGNEDHAPDIAEDEWMLDDDAVLESGFLRVLALLVKPRSKSLQVCGSTTSTGWP